MARMSAPISLAGVHEIVLGGNSPVIVDVENGDLFLSQLLNCIAGHERPFSGLGADDSERPDASRGEFRMGSGGRKLHHAGLVIDRLGGHAGGAGEIPDLWPRTSVVEVYFWASAADSLGSLLLSL